jgi:hypothetical protein
MPGAAGITLRYLYTGEAAGGGDADDAGPQTSTVLFGLMANAKFLLCDELTGDCLAVIKARSRSHAIHDKPVLAHPSFCPDLVPVSFIAEVLVDTGISARVRLEMVLTWMERAGGHCRRPTRSSCARSWRTSPTGRCGLMTPRLG